MKYGELTLGQVEAVVNKLGGMDGIRRLLGGKLIVINFDATNFPVWKTVTIGTGPRTLRAFRKEFDERMFEVAHSAEEIFEREWFNFKCTAGKKEVDLVIVSPGILGCVPTAPVNIFYKRARALGLEPCSREVILELCIQQKRKLREIRNSIFFAGEMEDIVFYIQNDERNIWLCSASVTDSLIAHYEDNWVFVLPHK